MPLDEVPVNIRRSRNSKQDASKEVEDGRLAASRPPPLAIQNMLKSTTEIGDVGMFAQRPSRIPLSSTQSSLAAQSHRTRPHRFDRPPSQMRRPARDFPPGLRRTDSVRSSQTAYQHRPRSKRPRPRPGPYPYQYPGHPNGSQHTLHSRRSLASLRSATAVGSLPSPYARSYHSASGQRLGRAVSPTLSVMYDYRNPPRHMSRHNSFSTVPSSPGSMLSTGKPMHDYRSEHNRSVTSFRPLPSPGIGPSSNRYRPPRHASFSRNPTPASAIRPSRRFGSMASLESRPGSPTDSIVPFYYDYSESFHGVDTLDRSPAEHPPIPEATVAQEEGYTQHDLQSPTARSPFGTISGSRFSPAELPTKHNRRPSEQSVRSQHSRRTSDRSVVAVRLSSQAIEVHPPHEHDQHIHSDVRETQVCDYCSAKNDPNTDPVRT